MTTTEPSTDAPQRSTATRLRWVLPAVLLIVWLAIAGIGGPYSGKLSEVQRNDTSSFLPKSAESTTVLNQQAAFASQQTFPGFVLLESDAALTPAQLQSFQQFAQGIPAIEVPVKGAAAKTIGDFLVPGPITVVPSKDGKAALAVLNFDANLTFSTLADGTNPIQASVEALRSADKTLDAGGVTVYVAGPAGTIADFVKAFAGIDGVLLGVALLAVLIILLVVYRSPVVPFFVLATSLFALSLASVVVYVLAKNDADQAQRAEPGHPLDPRHRRGHRLRPAPRLPLPGGAAPARRSLRGDVAGVAPDPGARRRLRRHGHPRPALPAAERAAVDEGPGPGRRRSGSRPRCCRR